VLVNSALLLRGVDIPSIDCVVMLRPTKSISLYQQAIGRGTRLAPFKEDLLLLDFLYDAQKKLVCRPAHLIAKDQEEAEAITEVSKGAMVPAEVGEQLTSFDLLGMASIAQAQRERALRKKLEEHKDRKAKHISAEEFAIKHKSLAIAEYEPAMPWESQPASDKQVAALKRFGIDPATVKGKGHASQLISLAHYVTPVEYVTPKQAALLRRFGWSSEDGMRGPDQATRREFGRFMGMRAKQKERELA
jgi:superfamily II DNA/RNA helicase